MLGCIFSVLYLRSYSPNSSRLLRRSKTHQICFEKRTSTIPSLSPSSRRNTSARLIRVTLCEVLEFDSVNLIWPLLIFSFGPTSW
jgi:hypothetical protein